MVMVKVMVKVKVMVMVLSPTDRYQMYRRAYCAAYHQ